jgi:3-methyladenine DNA glycosylase AlkD
MSRAWTTILVDGVASTFAAQADPERATEMSRYMKDQFAFVGLAAPERRRLQRELLRGRPKPGEPELTRIVKACWRRKEREVQYFAIDYVRAHVRRCSPSFISVLQWLISHKSWWDTVDILAAHGVGPLVEEHPALRATVDEWIDAEDFWLARSAIIHQLNYKANTDADRLFAYCRRRASDPELFIRKAIGWALREYSKTAPSAVRRFVEEHDETLSSLSKREALKWLERRPRQYRSRVRGARDR